MIDEDGVLERLNKSKRKKLMAFIKQHEGTEEARILPAGSMMDFPQNNRKDDGRTVYIFMLAKENYNGFYTLVDRFDKNDETFKHLYKRQSRIAELLGIDQTPAATNEPTYNPKTQYIVERGKVGRPKRTLSDTEKSRIDELRVQGKGYNAIAKELKVSNRLIIKHCQKR